MVAKVMVPDIEGAADVVVGVAEKAKGRKGRRNAAVVKCTILKNFDRYEFLKKWR